LDHQEKKSTNLLASEDKGKKGEKSAEVGSRRFLGTGDRKGRNWGGEGRKEGCKKDGEEIENLVKSRLSDPTIRPRLGRDG